MIEIEYHCIKAPEEDYLLCEIIDYIYERYISICPKLRVRYDDFAIAIVITHDEGKINPEALGKELERRFGI